MRPLAVSPRGQAWGATEVAGLVEAFQSKLGQGLGLLIFCSRRSFSLLWTRGAAGLSKRLFCLTSQLCYLQPRS